MELVHPKPAEWQERFQWHQARLRRALPGADVQHIGSTAIPGIQAKDVVDVLVGVPAQDISETAQTLQTAGYVQEGVRDGHVWLCWPNSQAREAVVHIMARDFEAWRNRLAFRDHLRNHPELAREYEALKRQIAAQTDDWGEYTQQKAGFVVGILANLNRS